MILHINYKRLTKNGTSHKGVNPTFQTRQNTSTELKTQSYAQDQKGWSHNIRPC